MNTVQKGSVGLARAIYEYQKLGYTICVPLIDAQDYDLVIEKDNKFFAVQCKFTSNRIGKTSFEVGLRSIRTNTKETIIKNRGQYDLLFVLCSNDDCYSIPSDKLPKITVNVGEKYTAYKL